MKKGWLFKLLAFTAALLLIVQAEVPVMGSDPEPVKIARTVSVATTGIGEEFTVHYTVSGDPITIPRTRNEICVVIDCSGSMNSGIDGKGTSIASKRRIEIAKSAAINFISTFNNTNTKIVVLPFSDSAGDPRSISNMVDMSGTASLSYLKTYVNSLSVDSSTNTGDALRIALNTLQTKGDPSVRKFIVLLTDGEPHGYTYKNKLTKDFYMETDGAMVNRTTLFYDASDSRSNDTYTKGYNYSKNWAALINAANVSGSRLYNTFMIGICENDRTVGTYDKTGLTREQRLENIALAAGASPVSSNPGYHFYKVVKESDLAAAYDDIAGAIKDELPFSAMMFSDLLPEGITIEPAVRTELAAKGFVINDITAGGKTRTQFTAPLNTVLKHIGSNAIGEVYQIDTTDISFSVKVVATREGLVSFGKNETSIDYTYIKPDGSSVSGKTYNSVESTVFVNLKDGDIGTLSDSTFFVGGSQTVTAVVIDPKLDTLAWSVDDGTVVQMTPNGNSVLLKGLKTGTATLSVKAQSSSGWYKEVTRTCKVNIVDVKLNPMYLLKGCENPLSITVDNPQGLPLGLTFSDWKEDGGSLTRATADGTALKITGKAAAVKAFTLSAVARTGAAEKEISSKVYVMDAEINPLNLDVPVFNTKAFTLNYILPDDGKVTSSDFNISTDITNNSGNIVFNPADWSVKGNKLTTSGPVILKTEVKYDPDPAVSGDEQKQTNSHNINVVATDIDLN